MNYKQIIKNQEIRFKILNLLKFVPDKIMLKMQYRIKMGRKLNLKNPKRYTEKIQWYKLNYRNPLMTKCADKYTVREYVESKGLGDILNELYGVYDSVEEIDFDKLPNRFVLKTTNDSHTNIFCEDKNKVNINKIKVDLNKFMKSRNVISPGREWAYENSKKRIICEKYLDKDENDDIPDYKFYCFNGKIECLNVIKNRNGDFKSSAMFDRNFKLLPIKKSLDDDIEQEIKKPENYDKMIKIAEILSNDFPHVRVDLYNIYGKIYFGELTFYPSSGYLKFEPDEFDFVLGKKFQLEKYKEEK